MDFNILHLSDLHIKATEGLQDNLEKLLTDISGQITNMRKIIVVVTGDIVDKGVYNDNSVKNVIEFFSVLKDILGDKFQSICIVPGNHDRVQCNSSNIILEKLRESRQVIEDITNEDWNYHLLSYQKFLMLEDEIYNVFFPSSASLIKHTETFGVEKYINNESVIIFIKIDSAWCSLGGDSDKRKLHVSKHQLEYLKNEYQKIKKDIRDKRILTIAICHHPINWLTEQNEEFLGSYFIDETYLNVDVILCGHVHDIEINNIHNNFHQITTLVTGIGWKKDTPMEKRNGHRYSIYIFNLRRNSCEAIVRKTDSSGNFDIDRDFLPDKRSKHMGKLSIPIIMRNNYPYIEIPIYNETGFQDIPLFIDKNILTEINKCTWKLYTLLSNMKEDLLSKKQDIYRDLSFLKKGKKTQEEALKRYFDSGEASREVENILSKPENKKVICSGFLTYLCELCNHFIDVFKDDFNENEDIRILFRYYNFTRKKLIIPKNP